MSGIRFHMVLFIAIFLIAYGCTDDVKITVRPGGAEENGWSSGECRYDSDCGSICEGNTKWKMGCDAATNTCEKTFDYDCTEQIETIAGYDFGKVCYFGDCQRDEVMIQAKRDELSDKVKSLLADKQEVTQMMYEADKNCISALEDVTDKLIIDTAVKLTTLPTSFLELGTDLTSQTIDALTTDPEKMSTEEFISLNCNLYPLLDKDLKKYDDEIEELEWEISELDAALAE